MMLRTACLLFLTAVLLPLPGIAQPPPAPLTPPQNVIAADAPNDEGEAIIIEWNDPAADKRVDGYAILRREGEASTGDPASRWRMGDPFPPAEWTIATIVSLDTDSYRDAGLEKGTPYIYAIAAMTGEQPLALSSLSGVAIPTAQWFHSAKGFLLITLLVVSAAILISVLMASRGYKFKIRKIAGIEAIEEAVGRATEMGKSVLFVPGIQDMDNVQTVAGITILGSVASMTAHYETHINVPVSKSLVMSTGRETVKEAYTTAGRPDLYSEEMVHYVTDEQFGYVASIDGYMIREKPATCIYMGAFYAESLILAETGNSIGAIQIAGTAQPTQLPFFVAACDYTLIGEELFAASAYLSKNPSLLGSLRGQDIAKALAMLFILVGVGAETIGRLSGEGSAILAVSDFIQRFFATNF